MKTGTSSIILEQAQKAKPNYWPIFFGIVGTFCGILLYRYRHKNQDDDKISMILRLLNTSFKQAEPELCPLTAQKTSEISDHNIKIKVNFISKLEKKNKITVSSTSNPFFPPFPKGMMITDLPPSHRLLFNKFYFYKNHLLVVTQSFEDQLKRLSIQDLQQSFLVMKALNGLFFFNSGPQSGFSQKHKHVQILPRQAKQLPIVSRILQDISSSKLASIKFQDKNIYFFKGYQFLHGIVLFSDNIQKKYLQIQQNQLKQAENCLFEYLSGKLKIKQGKFSYNVIGCEKFLLMIPRKQQKTMNDVAVNAILFMGSMLVKDQVVFERIEKFCKPTDLLNQVTFDN